MTDRANRALWSLLALLLLAVGGGGLSLALGAWGHAGPLDVVDPTVVRWWRDGRWMSFAAVAFIGLLLMISGLVLAAAEVRRRGHARLADFDPSEGGRSANPGPGLAGPGEAPRPGLAGPGEASRPGLAGPGAAPRPGARRGSTVVRAGPLNAAMESDLRSIGGVRRAAVGLFGGPTDLELRVRVDVTDQAELTALSDGLDHVLERFALTTNLFPSLVEVTLYLVAAEGDRVR